MPCVPGAVILAEGDIQRAMQAVFQVDQWFRAASGKCPGIADSHGANIERPFDRHLPRMSR